MIKIKSFYRINGIFFTLFGLFLIFQPEMSLRSIIIIISAGIILSGILGIIIAQSTTYSKKITLFIFSIIEIFLGIILLIFPQIGDFITSLFVIILGIFSIIKGILIIIDSQKAKKTNISNRWLLLITGIIMILFGIFLTTNAFLEKIVLTILIGLSITVYGIQMIIWGYQTKKRGVNRIEDIDNSDEDEEDDDD